MAKVRRRMVVLLAVCLMLLGAAPLPAYAKPSSEREEEPELRGVWISYLDWENLPSEEKAFHAAVDELLDRCVELQMNAVFVHVRADADAMYPSEYFPWSRFITGTQGVDPGYDPLEYFIDAAHERDLQFHAWINPFRVTGYHNSWDKVSDASCVKQWLTDSSTHNNRWVLKQNGAYYLNPAIPEVRQLIVNGVSEVVYNYDVDGIHFDDYFYPEVDDDDSSRCFDKPEYEKAVTTLGIEDWRRDNINMLIRECYQTVKEADENLLFGISPEGYVEHLRSDNRLFTDIDTWMSEDGYIDYIMPQIYWGFEQKLPNGSLAPYAFSENLKTWIALKDTGNVKLYLGLAMYKTGSRSLDNNETSEWLRYDNIISRQVEAGRKSGEVSGYCFYSFSSFQAEESQREVENLMTVLNE